MNGPAFLALVAGNASPLVEPLGGRLFSGVTPMPLILLSRADLSKYQLQHVVDLGDDDLIPLGQLLETLGGAQARPAAVPAAPAGGGSTAELARALDWATDCEQTAAALRAVLLNAAGSHPVLSKHLNSEYIDRMTGEVVAAISTARSNILADLEALRVSQQADQAELPADPATEAA